MNTQQTRDTEFIYLLRHIYTGWTLLAVRLFLYVPCRDFVM